MPGRPREINLDESFVDRETEQMEKSFSDSAKRVRPAEIEQDQDPEDEAQPPERDWLGILRQSVTKGMVKYRTESWGESAYVEWHTVADILDTELGVDWEFDIDNLQVGNKVAYCQATLRVLAPTKDNKFRCVSRSGVGVGEIKGEKTSSLDNAIKTAASDALKRCAVLFGVGRDLYVDPPEKEKEDDFYRENTDSQGARTERYESRPMQNADGKASEKQLAMIFAVCKKLGFNMEEECHDHAGVGTKELTKQQASDFITYLKKEEGRMQ